MSGEINAGMIFGNYNSMIKTLEEKYTGEYNGTPEKNGYTSECIFRESNDGKVKANAYKEKIRHTEYNVPLFADAVVFYDNYIYGTSAKDDKGLDKFDYIQGKTQYAIDLNGNDKVDDDEIFDGKIDRYVYRRAKESGDLSKYQELKNQYNY